MACWATHVGCSSQKVQQTLSPCSTSTSRQLDVPHVTPVPSNWSGWLGQNRVGDKDGELHPTQDSEWFGPEPVSKMKSAGDCTPPGCQKVIV